MKSLVFIAVSKMNESEVVEAVNLDEMSTNLCQDDGDERLSLWMDGGEFELSTSLKVLFI